MKKLYQITAITLISMLAFTGCNNDNDSTKAKVSANMNANTNGIKNVESDLLLSSEDIVFNEHNMLVHLREFQNIATENGGNRAVGSAGGKASAQYIIETAKRAGYTVVETEFKNKDNKDGKNIFVEISGESKNGSLVLLGAHYDSVEEGPGINDNASGVSVLLELMNQLSEKKITPKYTIRLAFWDSEETGIEGSSDYVSKLNKDQLKEMKAYINVDMVGSRFPTARIADADKSSLVQLEQRLKAEGKSQKDITFELSLIDPVQNHAGDLALEKSLTEFFTSQKIPVQDSVAVISRTDTFAFAGKVPIASMGLVNNADKPNELIQCYHQACDQIDLIDPKSLGIAGRAVVHLLKNLKTL